MRDAIVLAVTGVLALAALRTPLTGILAFSAMSILGPHSLTWGVARTFPHSQVIALATILGFLVSSEPKRLPREREVGLVFALWVLFAISTAFALRPEFAIERLIFVSKIFLMMLLATMIVNTPEKLHALVRVVAISLGLLAAKIGIFVFATALQQKAYGPEETYLFDENALGIALAANVPLLVYLFRVEQARWLRRALVAMICLSYPAVVATFSRGAWLSLGAVSVLLVTNSRRKILTFVLVLVLAIGVSIWQDRIVSDRLAARWDTLVNYQEDTSAESRLWNWEFCRRVGMARPVGGGFDFQSPEAYLHYYPEFALRWPGKVWVCHNTWLQFLAEHGVLGFLLGVGLFVSCMLSVRRLTREAGRQGTRSSIGELAPMVGVSFVAFLTGGTFLDVAYHELLYQLIAIVIIAKSLWRQGPDSSIGRDKAASASTAAAVLHEWRPRRDTPPRE